MNEALRSPLTVERLNEIMDAICKPTDPVEIRIGGPHALAGIPSTSSDGPRLHGLPVLVDATLPWNRIEVRARNGSTLVSIDRT